MRQALNVLGLIISLALTLSGGAVFFQIPGFGALVIGTLISMVGLIGVGIFLARILSYIDSHRQLKLEHSTRQQAN